MGFEDFIAAAALKLGNSRHGLLRAKLEVSVNSSSAIDTPLSRKVSKQFAMPQIWDL